MKAPNTGGQVDLLLLDGGQSGMRLVSVVFRDGFTLFQSGTTDGEWYGTASSNLIQASKALLLEGVPCHLKAIGEGVDVPIDYMGTPPLLSASMPLAVLQAQMDAVPFQFTAFTGATFTKSPAKMKACWQWQRLSLLV